MKLDVDFKSIRSRSELATALGGVPLAALDVVMLTDDTCRCTGCFLPAVRGNHKYCILHSQTWYPSLTDAKGKPSKNCRGHLLLGPEFMKSYNYPAESPCSCCCDDKTCEGIGYCHTGMFSLPMDTENAKKAMKAMRMHPDNQKNILKRIEKGSTPRIAPWHIHPRDRRIGPRLDPALSTDDSVLSKGSICGEQMMMAGGGGSAASSSSEWGCGRLDYSLDAGCKQ